MTEAVRCGRCGVRYDGRHVKCPRCGAKDPEIIEVAPSVGVSAQQGSRRGLAIAAAIVLAAVAVPAGWLWTTSGTIASTTASASAPSASAPPTRLFRNDDRTSLKPASRVPSEIPFIDSPAAGRREYAEGDYESALRLFESQVAAQPSNAEPYSNAGQVLVRLGRTTEAVPLLRKAAELDPNRWAYRFNLARAEGLLGQWDNAVQDYAEAAKLFPGDYATLFNLGQALHRAGREEDAVARYQQAIRQKPDDSSFYLALGISEEKLGHAAEAAAAYRRFVSMDPSARHAKAVAARAEQLESGPPASTAAPPAPAPSGM
jgi:tetratricopeptide (TPR) repeat protein